MNTSDPLIDLNLTQLNYKREKSLYLIRRHLEDQSIATPVDEALDSLVREIHNMDKGGLYGYVQTPQIRPSAHELLDDSGLIGPSKTVFDFRFGKNDSHLVLDDRSEIMTAYDYGGKKLWQVKAIGRGQYGETDYGVRGDTPPGIYRIGQVYKDYEYQGDFPAYTKTLRSYGWYSFDMEELENQEISRGRAGIMVHGGGSACGWPGAWNPRQTLHATLGCIRMYNVDLRDKLLPLCEKGEVYISVYQEKK